jgi:hypothetical protein
MRIYSITYPQTGYPDDDDLNDVWRLTHDAYVTCGYAMPNEQGILRHCATLDDCPETDIVLARDDNDELVGTISLTEDGPRGLHVDKVFKTWADQVRWECADEKKRLGASWRIVTKPEYRGTSSLLLKLICKTAELAFEKRNLDVLLYTFHPKHEKWYSKRLGFTHVAGPLSDFTVHNMPAVLVRGNRDETEYCLRELKRRIGVDC